MTSTGHVLVVDDDYDILTAAKLLLKQHFSQVTICNNPHSIPDLLLKNQFDAVMLDMNFSPGESSGSQGYNWLKKILEISPQMVVVMITAHGGIDVAVEAMKLGATDFVTKPWQNEKLVATLTTAVMLGQSRNEAQTLRDTNLLLVKDTSQTNQHVLLGTSGPMQQVYELVEKCAPTDANVLILGENGTGKELVARELHKQSLRADKVFMSVDLGAMSETLFESELFGHKKGAFTGAQQERIGRFQAANGGTLFLDEIGNLPLHLQTKLLTVLEQRTVTPLGSNKPIDIDVRIISATNIHKTTLSQEQEFRQDLLFRLNTVEITLPPLRHRIDDIPLIARHYVSLYAKKYKKPITDIESSALSLLQDYPWPGNVRALRHAIERAVVLTSHNQLISTDFQLDNQVLANKDTVNQVQTTAPVEIELNLDKVEKNTVETALKQHKYNISHAAKALGLTRATLYRRMEKHGL
ncbi:sigma-54 dependent transcriptional regulator [Paraglaciecola aquimarina]|uniref:Sigma-54 dependent transcriptional regulator n=1 Tax=Paraglaciecola algarum TaxID=3050085 RepID=A0ABS9D650_9ALTE|nr:sigma-54 dependent transcriptional regulator [Paraglaciecola sp. G1-23]MCF2947910.1 sigma-54 dependent transcriptional regulator [Paraglaciecola sp. G1-23]